MRLNIREILENSNKFIGKPVVIEGWIKTSRGSKNFGFIELNDGSCFDTLQVVYDDTLSNFSEINKYPISSSLLIKGEVVESPGAKQDVEIHATEVEVLALSSSDYPLQKKTSLNGILKNNSSFKTKSKCF